MSTTTPTPTLSTTIGAIGRITDPVERLKAAAALTAEAETAAKERRSLRDMAVIVARLDHDVPPVRIYRDLDISRALFNRILQRAPSDADRAAIVAEHPERFADPMATAATVVAEVRHFEQRVEEAREVRDALAQGLMNGEDPDGKPVPPVSNAEIARITGLTTARVAQLRTGGR